MARRRKARRWTSWSERELPHYQNDCQCLMPLFVVACARLLQYEANFADPEVPTSDVWLAIAYGEPEGPGQRYVNTFWKFEGEVGTAKACADCQVDIKAFAAAHGGSQFMPDYFVDGLKECIGDGDPESESVWKPMLERVLLRRPGVPR